MAITSQIKELVTLALSDRVLTYVERKTIVNAAIKEGISETEINQYLDNALHKRLQFYTKEELRSCPHCGAQIPLISDNCMFCGVTLEKDGNFKPIDITGDEADIIRAENLKTSSERTEIQTCPDCGAPFPLINHICTNCGHVLHEQRDNELNIKNLINNINESISTLKQQPKLKWRDVITDFIPPLLFYIFVAIWAFWIIYDAQLTVWFVLMNVLGPVILFVTFALGLDTKSPGVLEIENLTTELSKYEKFMRQLTILYGNNSEAKKLMQEYSSEIQRFSVERSKRRRSVYANFALILAFITLVLFGIGSYKVLEDLPDSLIDTVITLNSDTTKYDGKYLAPYDVKMSFSRSKKKNYLVRLNKVKIILRKPNDGKEIIDLLTMIDQIQILDKDKNAIIKVYRISEDHHVPIYQDDEPYVYIDFYSKKDIDNTKYLIEHAKYYQLD